MTRIAVTTNQPTTYERHTMKPEMPFLNKIIGLPISMLEVMAVTRPEFHPLPAMVKDAPALMDRRRAIVRDMEIADLLKPR